jgi:RNA polymerase sigma factor (sigma-70 family)
MRMDRGDVEALVATHQASLLRFGYLLTGSASEAEDLVQGAYLKLLGASNRAVRHPHSYARRTMLNLYNDRRDRSQARITSAPDGPSFESQYAERDLMWEHLQRLNVRHRAVLILRYYDDLADADIAEILGCRRATVRSLAARGLAQLRAVLGETDPHPQLATKDPVHEAD